jgi:hypothetical protein
MRTTLSIDDDLLSIARAQAEFERRSLGEVVSDLMRKAIKSDKSHSESRNGLVLLPTYPGRQPVTMELVNALRDEDGQ